MVLLIEALAVLQDMSGLARPGAWRLSRAKTQQIAGVPRASTNKNIISGSARLRLAARTNHLGTSSFLRVVGISRARASRIFFLEAQFEKLFLVGLADNLELIKLAPAEGFQHPLRVILDEPQVSRWAPPG